MSKNEVKSEKDELKELKDRRDQCKAKITAIEEKSAEYRAALEEARNTASEITKRIAGATINNEPLTNLKAQLSRIQNDVAFNSKMVEELEGNIMDEARRDLQAAKAALEEFFIETWEPRRKATIDRALEMHSLLEGIEPPRDCRRLHSVRG